MLIYSSKQTIISISMIRIQKAIQLFWSTEITQPNIELAQIINYPKYDKNTQKLNTWDDPK